MKEAGLTIFSILPSHVEGHGAPQKSGGARQNFSAGDFRGHFVTLNFHIASGATVVIHCIVGNVHNKKLLHKIIYICTIIYN